MINDTNGSDTFNALAAVELELLEALLEPDDAVYPWNPADDDSEAYFSELEKQFATQDWLDEDLRAKSSDFYDKLDHLWSEVTNDSTAESQTDQSLVDSLQITLNSVFADTVPQTLLQAIAQKAVVSFTAEKSLAEQIVQCVQSVLPSWDIDDLFVLARPFAYAMRSRESPEAMSHISRLQNREWMTLSEIEKAKVSVAIAYCALQQLDSSESPE
jgi:hypothetical protein